MVEAPHPGKFIENELNLRGWGTYELAAMTTICQHCIERLIAGEVSVNDRAAEKLGEALGFEPELFINMQKAYDEAQKIQKH